MLHLSHIPAQVAGIAVVTFCEDIWQHGIETLLLEEEVTIPLSTQECKCQQCSLDEAVYPWPSGWVLSDCLKVVAQLLVSLGAILVETLQ